jgi:RND family efflux transporter MFP subunit
MKTGTIYLSLAIFLLACGGVNTNNEIATLKHKKDSLKNIYDDIALQIAKIDEELISLDTLIKLPLVTVNTVEEKEFEHFVDVQGAVEVGGNALVYPQVPGKVISIHSKEGSKVNKGDLIIQLDAGVLSSSIKEVEKAYNLANDIYEKQARLWKDNIGSEVQYLQAKTNAEALKQKLTTLKEQLDMYAIRAPFSGVLDEINPNVGEAVNPIYPAIRVINYKDIYVKADVSENYMETVKEEGKAIVYFSSLDKEFITKISRVGNFINPNNRTFKISIDLADLEANLKPNLLADIKIRDFTADTAVVIPSKIIQQDRKGNEYIYIVDKEGNKIQAKKVIITSGLSYKEHTLVLTGLKGGEKYIDKGARSIQDGESIEIVIE